MVAMYSSKKIEVFVNMFPDLLNNETKSEYNEPIMFYGFSKLHIHCFYFNSNYIYKVC